jgi:DNA-binding response OmpR family regulator
MTEKSEMGLLQKALADLEDAVPAGKEGRIVVVDDEPDFLVIVGAWLALRHDVVTYTEGAGLLETLEFLKPDLLVLDVMMPGIDGFKVCKQITVDQRYQSMPILFLTASHNDSDFIKNVEVGGTSYLTKPVSRRQLLSRIGRLLKDARGEPHPQAH